MKRMSWFLKLVTVFGLGSTLFAVVPVVAQEFKEQAVTESVAPNIPPLCGSGQMTGLARCRWY
jgi:hypothetical protein